MNNRITNLMLIREAAFQYANAICAEHYATESWMTNYAVDSDLTYLRYLPDDFQTSLTYFDLQLSLNEVSRKIIIPFVLSLPSVVESKHQAYLRELAAGNTEYDSWSETRLHELNRADAEYDSWGRNA